VTGLTSTTGTHEVVEHVIYEIERFHVYLQYGTITHHPFHGLGANVDCSVACSVLDNTFSLASIKARLLRPQGADIYVELPV
jgi:hypothetical protein